MLCCRSLVIAFSASPTTTTATTTTAVLDIPSSYNSLYYFSIGKLGQSFCEWEKKKKNYFTLVGLTTAVVGSTTTYPTLLLCARLPASKKASKQAGKQAGEQAGKRAGNQAAKQPSKQAGKQPSRQAGKQAKQGRAVAYKLHNEICCFPSTIALSWLLSGQSTATPC